jgi:transcriptional regulator with XRE-family HTH domain
VSPEEFKEARQSLGLSLAECAELLGYEGDYSRQQVHRIETGERRLREAQRRLMQAYLEGYRPQDWP